MLLHVLQLHATVHGYAGDVRVLQPNGMIAPGLPCGRAGRNHDNITLYSCDRPSPYCSRARICPRYRRQSIDVCTGAEIVVPVRNFGPFSRTRTRQSPKSTYPDKQNRRNTANPEINILSRFSRRTIDVQTGAGNCPGTRKTPVFANQDSDFCPGTHIKRLMHEPDRIASLRRDRRI